ncbi:MAG: serine/threonine-protein kinase, partial [Planctomycetota bacterium]
MQVAGYEILKELGRGASGVVYKARARDGREVALKVLLRTDRDLLVRFEREKRLLATLGESHGFVPLYDSGGPPAAQAPFVVMPFMEGGTLRDRMGHGPMGVVETLELGEKVACALAVAHERGLVHRDLKPENVLFTGSGTPLVADLGLAKHFDKTAFGASQSHSVTGSGALVGTIGYMSPEQMVDARTATPAADVFAVGSILQECLTGAPTYQGA